MRGSRAPPAASGRRPAPAVAAGQDLDRQAALEEAPRGLGAALEVPEAVSSRPRPGRRRSAGYWSRVERAVDVVAGELDDGPPSSSLLLDSRLLSPDSSLLRSCPLSHRFPRHAIVHIHALGGHDGGHRVEKMKRVFSGKRADRLSQRCGGKRPGGDHRQRVLRDCRHFFAPEGDARDGKQSASVTAWLNASPPAPALAVSRKAFSQAVTDALFAIRASSSGTKRWRQSRRTC